MTQISPDERKHLVSLVERLQDSIDLNQNRYPIIAEFEKYVPNTGKYLEEICGSDYPAETIVDVCIGLPEAQKKLTRDQFADLVNLILTKPTADEVESILRIASFNFNCINPAGIDLLFNPEESLGVNNPTIEMIVDAALTAKK